MRRRALSAFVVTALFLISTLTVVGVVAVGTSSHTASPPAGGEAVPASGGAPASRSPGETSPAGDPPSFCASLTSIDNDPGYAAFVHRVHSPALGARAAGVPAADLPLPYAGAFADQDVNGVVTPGSELTQECERGQPTTSQTAPTGVAYDGQTDTSGVRDVTLESNSVAGVLTVNSPTSNFYPGSGTPTVWGAQENVVLPNVTLLGQQCPSEPCAANGSGNYAFWVQNVVSYDSNSQSLSFVDDTWNFTSYTSEMLNSSLVDWSPNGGNYTGTWVAFSQTYHVPTPFTVTVYTNTSVDAADDQVLWYNYSVRTPSAFIGNGNYDYLVFDSQPAGGPHLTLRPPDFEASAVSYHVVNDGYEFDALIGADDGANQLIFAANATMKLEYCVAKPDCSPTHFAYANVPAAVNYGSQTGEEAIGVAVNYVGTTAYLSAGPLILHGLWNFTGAPGVVPGNTKVTNAVQVSGDPEGPLASQPYVFVFLENHADAYQGYQWAPDTSAWFLAPGTYRYEVMLADYAIRTGTLHVGTTPTTLSATLPYDPALGVYTPLWAFGNGQLSGISFSGTGSLHDQFQLFNNPTTGADGIATDNLSAFFFSANDYLYPSFPGVLLDATSAYGTLDSMPSFCVGSSDGFDFYLGLEFFDTSHVTLLNDPNLEGWPAWSEIAFYYDVPASQNPAPQAEVFVWNSSSDLIDGNDFVGTNSFGTPPDGLVLYGGSDNVVWGNTFTDAPGTTPSTAGGFAGIGLGESGDLIYNNNFSVDNPVVYLPYNWPNVADCLPQSLGACTDNANDNGWYFNVAANVVGSTWNVPLQSSSVAVHTVDGYRLAGNVLGPAVTTQGGNYYWNYGTSPNNYSTRPYVSRFYYSMWSEIFPLGCGSIEAPGAPCGTPPPIVGAYENGITAGGDDAPYGPTLIFRETGLSLGTEWFVTINGTRYASTQSTLAVPEPYGLYGWFAMAYGWHAMPFFGTAFASGASVISLSFERSGGTGPFPPVPSTTSYPMLARRGDERR
ncbi:MAG TPA: thermopsin family protease [Thermoplasmata archaeon]|nr:thermopsin family protease [Thermoplasmata archaeon]